MGSTCLRCGRADWLEYGHWRICPYCEPEFAAAIQDDARQWAPKVELKDKGAPSKPGPPANQS